MSTFVGRTLIAASSAIGALRNPTREDLVAALGETTGPWFLGRIRNKMLLDPLGRRILSERPVINTSTTNMDRLRTLPKQTFGRAYVDFLDQYKVSPDTRTPVRYLSDPDLAYIMQRYREIHDFWHTLTGLSVSVESEILLKWFEMVQTGLPVATLSAIAGPLRLGSTERQRLISNIPWAIYSASNSKFLMNVMYEDLMEKDFDEVVKELNIVKFPENNQ
ncbi:Ubiquinone biosynthesis protein [Nowakowskiella sp. JEL0407]|nr:Ubiquinone biosynthesis protein [Nowakowskiella sp. JEL0407]